MFDCNLVRVLKILKVYIIQRIFKERYTLKNKGVNFTTRESAWDIMLNLQAAAFWQSQKAAACKLNMMSQADSGVVKFTTLELKFTPYF